MVQLEGRTLNPEKIMFKSNSVSAGMEADWGRTVVKENVISAVRYFTLCKVMTAHSLVLLGAVKELVDGEH